MRKLTKTFTRSIAAALTVATLATSIPMTSAVAAPSGKAPAVTTTPVSSDFSARRYYRRGNGAAGLAAFAAVVGTIGAIAAAQDRRDYYNRYGYYGYAPPPPYGYGYGPRYRYW
jgi:hypothetical protein